MGPNDIDLGRVYVTHTGGSVPDKSPLGGSNQFEVVVEGECGLARLSGAPYETTVYAFDLTTGASAGAAFSKTDKDLVSDTTPTANGTKTVPWPNYRQTFTVTVPAASKGHLLRYYAVINAAMGQDVLFVESELFILV